MVQRRIEVIDELNLISCSDDLVIVILDAQSPTKVPRLENISSARRRALK